MTQSLLDYSTLMTLGPNARCSMQTNTTCHQSRRDAIFGAGIMREVAEMLAAAPTASTLHARKRALALIGDLGAQSDEAKRCICGTEGLLDALLEIIQSDIEQQFTKVSCLPSTEHGQDEAYLCTCNECDREWTPGVYLQLNGARTHCSRNRRWPWR